MEKYYVAVLNAVNLLGSARVRRLVEIFGSAERAWRAGIADISQIDITEKAINSFIDFRQQNPDAVEWLIEFCHTKKIEVCSFFDEDYPPILKEIPNPPVVFYYRGKLNPKADRIAMVGTRHNTSYGERVARELAGELAEAGFTIVSGAARGIDTFSHRGALKFGRTIAVLGYGINKIPHENKKFFEEITERGVIMSEFPPNMTGDKNTFPIRNRIIAGLSRGVIVVEAGVKSGALITSTYAGDFGRDVFAVPGNVYSEKSYGCNELIRDGANLINSAKDVLEYYNCATNRKIDNQIELEGNEQKIFDLIPSGEYITLDEILMQIDDIDVEEISQIVLNLEQKNCIVENADRYTRA